MPSSETSQLSAMPGLGARVSGSKLRSSSQLSAQIVYSSSLTPTKGLSVFGSCAQPIRRTSLSEDEPESCADPVEASRPSATAATSTAVAARVFQRFTALLLGRLPRGLPPPGSPVSCPPRRCAPAPPAASSPCACRARTGTFAIAGIPSGRDQLVEDLLDRQHRLGRLGDGQRLQVDVGPEHEPGHVVELAGADQVVERGVDQVGLGEQVLDHHDAAVRLDLVRGADARAQERQAATDQRTLAHPVADGEHVGVVGVVEDATQRAPAGTPGETRPRCAR